MNEAEWLASDDPLPMLACVVQLAGPEVFRKAMLFGCACCREVWELLPPGARAGVEAVESAVEVTAGLRQIARAEEPVIDALPDDGFASPEDYARYYAVGAVLILVDKDNFKGSQVNDFAIEQAVARVVNARVGMALHDKVTAARRRAEAGPRRRLAGVMRDVFGNPFRERKLPKKWLTKEGTATARRICDGHAFRELPALADALVAAGCDDEELLHHCRGRGPHVRGCWAVDLILGHSFPARKLVKLLEKREAERVRAETPQEPGAVRVCVDEAYGLAFAYDEGNRKALEKTALAEFGPEIYHEKAAGPLQKTGLIRIFDFDSREREDPFAAEVYVGRPPAAERVTKASARRPQRGPLHLPTGKLRVETTTSLSVGPEEPENEGVTVTVPPGTYDAALFVRKADKVHLLVLTSAKPGRRRLP
jgi:hypothetical protein